MVYVSVQNFVFYITEYCTYNVNVLTSVCKCKTTSKKAVFKLPDKFTFYIHFYNEKFQYCTGLTKIRNDNEVMYLV